MTARVLRLLWVRAVTSLVDTQRLSRPLPSPGINILQVLYRGTGKGAWSRWRSPAGTWPTEVVLSGILRWLASETHHERGAG
jgi:hypothetical protein